MRLTTRSEYALLALIHLGRQAPDAYLSVHSIASSQGIPPKFLEQILLALKRSRVVQSQRGQRGGYRLARAAEKISLAEIVRLFDGPLAPTDSASKHFYGPTPVERERKLLRVFREIRDHVADKLESTTIAGVS
ncbi:MAG TPA: Rrf2 family transcriptional regulator [Candidatus Eisenbacteria bacterium]|nr:Rrf2 family transcriptional regulator [Candidatus Eisenbacteria bacterium]